MKELQFKIRGNMNGIRYPALMDIKFDGVLVHVQHRYGSPLRLTTKEGVEWQHPYLDLFIERCPQSAEFLAEWIHGDGRNGALYALLSARGENMFDTSLRIFDVISIDGKKWSGESLLSRHGVLLNVIKPEYLVKSRIVDNQTEVLVQSRDANDGGFEGIVVKNLNETLQMQSWVKLKRQDIVALTVTKVEDTRFEVLHGQVIVGVRKIFPVSVGDIVEIKHQGVQNSGSLRCPVVLRKIQEVKNATKQIS